MTIMNAKRKQQITLGLGIFLSGMAISFSYNGQDSNWTWQKMPFMAIALLLLAFVSIRLWLLFEIERQRDIIRQSFEMRTSNPQQDPYLALSVREKEVLKLVMEGKQNKEIADTLFVALSTIKTHINNIYKILEVQNRREALEKLHKTNRTSPQP